MPNNRNTVGLWRAVGLGALAGAAYLLNQQNRLLRRVLANQEAVMLQIRDESRHQTRQAQALYWLHRELELAAPLPPMRGWAISPDFAVLLVQLLREQQPHTVLEFGGGTSTIITAAVLRQLGGNRRVVAVEALASFAQQARVQIERHGLEDLSQVIHAPLVDMQTDGRSYRWYQPQAFAHVDNIDFLTVDGPAQYNTMQPRVRYPAYPMLRQRLTDNALVLLDDANRVEEQAIGREWLRRYPALTQQASYSELEKGAVVLRHRVDGPDS